MKIVCVLLLKSMTGLTHKDLKSQIDKQRMSHDLRFVQRRTKLHGIGDILSVSISLNHVFCYKCLWCSFICVFILVAALRPNLIQMKFKLKCISVFRRHFYFHLQGTNFKAGYRGTSPLAKLFLKKRLNLILIIDQIIG